MSVDDLRRQLRERGYLTHGIERWFALDPWSSRAFWLELATVALKAAALIAWFAALPMAAIMALRDQPLQALDTLALFLSYALTWLTVAFSLVIIIALALKVRPALPIDTPRALLAISFGTGAVVIAPIAIWWSRFDTRPSVAELAVGAALSALLFTVTAVVVSAALLSFSIYEVQRVPALHQKPRGKPMAIAAALLVALLFVPSLAKREAQHAEPMIVTTPTSRRLAWIAVDGLTYEIVRSRPDLARALPHVVQLRSISADSTAERWASIGTGTPSEKHAVRAVEGVRFAGSSHLLQQLSRADFVVMRLAPLAGLARREPLPPTVRRRDYVWEIFATRGVPSVAVNWWATTDGTAAGLRTIGPESVFGAARGEPLRVDAVARSRFFSALDTRKPRFATIYLPALDVILNRLDLDRSAQLAQSLTALDGIANAIRLVQARGYHVIVVGVPGESQRGNAVIASSLPLRIRTAWDIAPTLLDLMGFPSSDEMPGTSGRGGLSQTRITTYGDRETSTTSAPLHRDYYENLKSLGYIQ